MANSDNASGTFNKQTKIISQVDVNNNTELLCSDGGMSYAVPSSITLNNPIRIVVTKEHGLTDRTKVTFKDVIGTTELNGNTYYAKIINATTIDLYSDHALSTTVDGGGSFTAYANDNSGQITFVLAKTVFANTDDAIDHFFTSEAQAVMNETCTLLQWALVANNTELKTTFAFGTKGTPDIAEADDWAGQYNSRKTALLNVSNWTKVSCIFTDSSDHLV